ncbi:hypothetical protein PGB90_006396 [Kerria lacca]
MEEAKKTMESDSGNKTVEKENRMEEEVENNNLNDNFIKLIIATVHTSVKKLYDTKKEEENKRNDEEEILIKKDIEDLEDTANSTVKPRKIYSEE